MRSFSVLPSGWIAGIFVLFLIAFTACKDGGSTGPDPNTPSEENMSASFKGNGSFVPGQFGEIAIEGTTLSSDIYSAKINDTDIELISHPDDSTDDATLVFVAPELPAGTHRLEITIQGQLATLDMTIDEYEAIAKPTEYTKGYISDLQSRLESHASETGSEELKSWLENILSDLGSYSENISELGTTRIQQLAYIIRENLSNMSAELPGTPKGCSDAKNRINANTGLSEEMITLFKLGSTGSMPGYEQAGNTFVKNLSLSVFADPVAQVQAAYAVALKKCISEPVTQLESAEQLKEKPTYAQLAETQSLDFFPGQSEAFFVRSTFTPPDELLIAVEKFLASQEPLLEHIPEPVRTYFLEPPEELTQMRDPELFNIENISLGSVQHTQQTEGDEIVLAFSYKQGQDPDEPQTFTFELADQENPDYPAQVEANLDINDFDINLEFEGGESAFLPGRLAVINQKPVTLDKETYDGLIDGEHQVDLTVPDDGNDQLLFLVPELSEGQHSLKIRLAGRKVGIDFSIESYQSIDDPETYTNDIIDETDGKLEAIQNETENQQVADRIQQVRDDLANSRSEFKKLSADEKKMVARTIKTNVESFTSNISSKMVTASFDAEKCTDLAGVLVGEKNLIERGLKAIIATSYTSIVFGPVAAAVVAGVGIGKFIQSTQMVLETYQEALDACLSDPVRTLQEDLANAKSATATRNNISSTVLSFTHNEAKDFYVQTTYTVYEDIRIAYNDYLALLDPLLEYLPGQWESELENQKTELTQVDNPSRFSITGISKSGIGAEIQSKSEQIDLNFSYKQGQMPDSEQSFSFTLTDSELPDNPTTFEATLVPVDLPKVADLQITLNKDETYKGTLEGEFTDKFEIVETVQYGELTLDDAEGGSFTYIPAENLVTKEDHPDSFTYRGINENGADTAQVTINVVDNTPVAYDDQFKVEMNSYYEGTLRADHAEEFVIVDSTDHGELDLNQVNGDFRYTPNEDYYGEDSFSFKAVNEVGESEVAKISIQVQVENPPRVESDKSLTTWIGETYTDTLKLSQHSLGPSDKFEIVEYPERGEIVLDNPEMGIYRYTPPSDDYIGAQSFTYKATNAAGESNLGEITLLIRRLTFNDFKCDIWLTDTFNQFGIQNYLQCGKLPSDAISVNWAPKLVPDTYREAFHPEDDNRFYIREYYDQFWPDFDHFNREKWIVDVRIDDNLENFTSIVIEKYTVLDNSNPEDSYKIVEKGFYTTSENGSFRVSHETFLYDENWNWIETTEIIDCRSSECPENAEEELFNIVPGGFDLRTDSYLYPFWK